MDDLSCKQRCANVVAMEMLKNCKSAQTKAQYYGIQKTTSERSEWFHKNKFDIMMAWMTPVSLHFSDVPTGSNNLYRQTTVGYWFCMFVTNSLSRRTVLQINLRQLHSVPCATRYASLPAPTSICSFISKLKTRLLSLTYQISSVPWCRGWPQLQTKVRKHSCNGNA